MDRAIVGLRIFVSRNELLIANWRSFHATQWLPRRGGVARAPPMVKAIDNLRGALQWQWQEGQKERVGAHIHGSLRDSDEL